MLQKQEDKSLSGKFPFSVIIMFTWQAVIIQLSVQLFVSFPTLGNSSGTFP